MRVNRIMDPATTSKHPIVHALLCLTLVLSLGHTTSAQRSYQGKIIQPSGETTRLLDGIFSNSLVFQMDVRQLHEYVSQNPKSCDVTLSIGNAHTWEIDLWQNEMRPSDHVAEATGPNGRVKLPRAPCTTYAGNLLGQPKNIVRLNVEPDRIWGYIWDENGKQHFVEPLREFVPGAASNVFIHYLPEDQLRTEERSCGASDPMEHFHPTMDTTLYDGSTRMEGNDCRKLDIATEADWEFYDDGETLNDILGNLNMVEGIYFSYFQMTFRVRYQHIWTISADPYTSDESGCDGNGQMDEFATYWYNNFSHIRRDINVLYSEKDYTDGDLGGTIGCAMTGEFGNNEDNDGYVNDQSAIRGAYCVNEWIDGAWTANDRTHLIAHEMGHVFGASHDNSTDNIMESSFSILSSAQSNFLTTTVSEMEAKMNWASSVANDGRSAIRERYFPSSTLTTFPMPTPGIVSGNVTIADASCSFETSTAGAFTFSATDTVRLLPGFHASPEPGQDILMKIAGCGLLAP